jgi:hypothetical protein
LLLLVTPSYSSAITPTQRRWENADLIVEGIVIETKTENNKLVSTIQVDRILKTEITITNLYMKGYVEELLIQAPANSLANYQPYRIFLEQDQDTYMIMAAEKIDDQNQVQLIHPGSTGLLVLMLIAIATQRPQILPKKKG